MRVHVVAELWNGACFDRIRVFDRIFSHFSFFMIFLLSTKW